MTILQHRFRTIIRRLGESFTVGGTPGTGIFAPISTGLAAMYLTDSERASLGRPIRIVYVPYDDATAESASMSWDGLTLTVRRVVKVRFRGVTVAKMLLIA